MGGVNEIKSSSPLSNEGNPLLSRKKVEKKGAGKRILLLFRGKRSEVGCGCWNGKAFEAGIPLLPPPLRCRSVAVVGCLRERERERGLIRSPLSPLFGRGAPSLLLLLLLLPWATYPRREQRPPSPSLLPPTLNRRPSPLWCLPQPRT